MNLQEIKSRLKKLNHNGKLDQFFAETQQRIASEADIHSLLIILKSRYAGLKMDRIKGVLSETEESKAQEELRSDINDWISLLEPDDLTGDPVSFQSLYQEIATLQEEMEIVTDERADGIINAGKALQKLGSILKGEKSALKQDIPMHELIKGASAKARRRMTIAGSEIKAVRKYQYQTFNSMIHAYRNLLQYLDYPSEEVSQQDKEKLEMARQRLEHYVAKLEEGSASVSAHFAEVVNFLDLLLSQKEELLPLIGKGFEDFEAMKRETLSIIDFYWQDDQQALEVASRLKTILLELRLSLEELNS